MRLNITQCAVTNNLFLSKWTNLDNRENLDNFKLDLKEQIGWLKHKVPKDPNHREACHRGYYNDYYNKLCKTYNLIKDQ